MTQQLAVALPANALNDAPSVARLALDAFVWTGEGSPTLAERRKRLPEFIAKNRRPIDRAFVQSIFARDAKRRGALGGASGFTTAIAKVEFFSGSTKLGDATAMSGQPGNYALALGGPRWFGAVAPLGGAAFILGWLSLALAALLNAET